jgi:hypothetical protein
LNLVDSQISIFSVIPEEKKVFFIDVYATSYICGRKKQRRRLRTIEWDSVPRNLHVSIPKKLLEKHPLGTIFKMDTRLVTGKSGKNYLSAIRRHKIAPAVEFFSHNLKVLKLNKGK